MRYTVENIGRRPGVWGEDYATVDEAAEALRVRMGWESVSTLPHRFDEAVECAAEDPRTFAEAYDDPSLWASLPFIVAVGWGVGDS